MYQGLMLSKMNTQIATVHEQLRRQNMVKVNIMKEEQTSQPLATLHGKPTSKKDPLSDILQDHPNSMLKDMCQDQGKRLNTITPEKIITLFEHQILLNHHHHVICLEHLLTMLSDN